MTYSWGHEYTGHSYNKCKHKIKIMKSILKEWSVLYYILGTSTWFNVTLFWPVWWKASGKTTSLIDTGGMYRCCSYSHNLRLNTSVVPGAAGAILWLTWRLKVNCQGYKDCPGGIVDMFSKGQQQTHPIILFIYFFISRKIPASLLHRISYY